MSRIPALLALLSACLWTPPASATEPRFALEVEGGPVWQDRNDVQIPNDASGTRFSLVDVAGDGPWGAGRAYLTWNLGGRSALRVLAAPFSITETGILEESTGFAGVDFAPGVPTRATYKFNSWRLTYRYRLHDGDRWSWWLGFTAKLRDAKVRLEQPGAASEDTDLGFVPLLHVRADWRFAEAWRFSLDADALAGGPGRAIDGTLKLVRDLGDRLSVSAGYRTLEGGADVDAVYNFAWLHYAVVSTVIRF